MRKHCLKCTQLLDLDDFVRNKNCKDGRGTWCRACHNARYKKYRQEHYAKTRETELAYRRANRHKEEEYRRNNKAKFAEYHAALYQENKEAMAERHRQYNLTERGRLSSIVRLHRRRALKRAASVGVAVDHCVITRLRTEFAGKCAWCGGAQAKTLDHITPIAHGGAHSADNLVPCCHGCNSRKQAKDPVIWAAQCGVDLAVVLERVRRAVC